MIAFTMAIEQSVDEMQVPWPAASGTDGERSGQMSFGAGCEGGHLLMANMHPLDPGLSADSIGQAVEAVADNAINPLDTRCGEDVRKLIGYRIHGVLGSSTTSIVLTTRTPDGPVVSTPRPRRVVNIEPICR
jgi:hypothetical protein